VNSVYFYGRSHEHNLLNISIPFLFLFLLGGRLILKELPGNRVLPLLPWALVLFTAVVWSGRQSINNNKIMK